MAYGADLSTGWTDMPADGIIAASTNAYITVAEANSSDEAVGAGSAKGSEEIGGNMLTVGVDSYVTADEASELYPGALSLRGCAGPGMGRAFRSRPGGYSCAGPAIP